MSIVLIVEDDVSLWWMLQASLRTDDLEVLEAGTGEDDKALLGINALGIAAPSSQEKDHVIFIDGAGGRRRLAIGQKNFNRFGEGLDHCLILLKLSATYFFFSRFLFLILK